MKLRLEPIVAAWSVGGTAPAKTPVGGGGDSLEGRGDWLVGGGDSLGESARGGSEESLARESASISDKRANCDSRTSAHFVTLQNLPAQTAIPSSTPTAPDRCSS